MTAGVAAPAYAGIPVTHREEASAVAFITGHEDPAKDESALDWEALARFPGHARLLHGRAPAAADRRPAYRRGAGRRRAGGRRGARHAARASGRSRRRSPSSPTRSPRLGSRRRRSRWSAPWPATAMGSRGSSGGRCTGDAWWSPGRVPRRAGLPRRCASWAPTLSRRRYPDRAAAGRSRAHRLRPRLLHEPQRRALVLRRPCPAWKGRALARGHAGGRHRAGNLRELRARGIQPDVIPERSVAESLVESLSQLDVAGKRALIARAADARDVLPDGLAELGAEVW